MYHRQRTLGRHGKPRRISAQTDTWPACVGGLNALNALIEMPARDFIDGHNLVPSEYSLRLRKGYLEWNTIAGGDPINSLIPYEGGTSDSAEDRLWAVTQNGIYDISSKTPVAPVQDVVFAVQVTGEAGYGVHVETTNDAEEKFLFFADAENGLHRYQEGTGWVTLTAVEITTKAGTPGPAFDPTTCAFVTTWKHRVWMVMQDSGDAWYLPPDAVQGEATKFTFGSKFQHGGELKALYSWTRDGGDGADDFLIAISRGGDVLVYQGTDPETDFNLVGSFFIGEVPESRRLSVSYGDDLFLLSTYGLISLKELLSGRDATDMQGPSAKVNRFLRSAVQEKKDDFAWTCVSHPQDGLLMITEPYDSARPQDAIQYVRNLLTGAWGKWRGVPANAAETWNEDFYVGDQEGNIWIYDGTTDGALQDGTPGDDVTFDLLTSFQALKGDHANNKQVGFIRTIGFGAGAAAINVDAVYDYDLLYMPGVPGAVPPSSNAQWGVAQWAVAQWASSQNTDKRITGTFGMGGTVAIALRGSANTRINVIGWDLTYKQGGFL